VPIDVVVLGGGYVGVWAARKVARANRRRRGARRLRVTLVSMAPNHSFHGWTSEVITGHVAAAHARVPLTDLLPGVRVVHGAVAALDLEARTVDVVLEGGAERLRYDHLVLGLGSSDALERVPGLAQHGWSLKHDRALADLDAHLRHVVERASSTTDPRERRRLLDVVVAGGGFSGTEAAAAIASRLRAAAAADPTLADHRPAVTLLTPGAQVLPSLRPRFGRVADYATGELVRAGVTLRFGSRLAAVSAEGAVLDDGTLLRSATVVATLGQRPCAPAGSEMLARDPDGRLLTDTFLRVAPEVWAGGDVAAVPHPSGAGWCPANALWAIYHGKRIGGNVVRVLRGRPPLPFRFPGLGQAASYGVGVGAAELYGLSLTGWPAWVARWVFFHAYMPSRRVALATATGWRRRRPARPEAGGRPWEDRPRAARGRDRRSLAP
jgi:NADH dehydrogenase